MLYSLHDTHAIAMLQQVSCHNNYAIACAGELGAFIVLQGSFQSRLKSERSTTDMRIDHAHFRNWQQYFDLGWRHTRYSKEGFQTREYNRK
jgi:hypothetical protein